MRKNKKIFSFMLALFMVISIVSPVLVKADPPTGSLTIHKLYFPDVLGTTTPGTGEIQTPPAGAFVFEPARFTIWKVKFVNC